MRPVARSLSVCPLSIVKDLDIISRLYATVRPGRFPYLLRTPSSISDNFSSAKAEKDEERKMDSSIRDGYFRYLDIIA